MSPPPCLPLPPPPSPPHPRCLLLQERVLSFGNVELNDKATEDKNAAEMVVARGFATVIRHRRWVLVWGGGCG